MARAVELHPAAVAEAAEIRAWYAERAPAVATALVEELDRAITAIAERPERWPAFVHGTRRYLLRRFPYSVVFRVEASRILIVAFVHGRRRPGYWRSR